MLMEEKVEVLKEIEVSKFLLEEIEEISKVVKDKYTYGGPGNSKATIISNAKTIRRLMNNIIKKYTPEY